MSRLGSGSVIVLSLLITLAFLLALFLPLAHAAGQIALPPDRAAVTAPHPVQPLAALDASALAALQVDDTTTLTVAIHSSPVAVRDNNDAAVSPRVFVVHAVVTNTGSVAATELLISLDYQEDPANEWVLVDGEEPQRTPSTLAPGESYHAYWFASYPYPAGADLSHQYEVSASAANAPLVSTTENVFDPQPDRTVRTASYIDTGNNGQLSLSTEITVGVAFTMAVGYDLGTGAQGAIFSPVGNLDFDASRLRLQEVSVRFYDQANPPHETVVVDQLYFPTLPALPNNATPVAAEVTYTFLARQPGSNTLCPYLGIDYGSTQKYDNQYCEISTTAILTGTLGFDFEKAVSDLAIQEGETLTYTLRFTNTGTLPMIHTWIWDETDLQLGEILPAPVSPAPTEISSTLVAWYHDWVNAQSSQSYTFSFLVDAATADLQDGQQIVNNAYLGINEGSLPAMAATTATVTTTVMAPALTASKTDGLTTVDAGAPLTYTIAITNDGSVAAVDLSATDLLPAGVQLAGTPSPLHSSQNGQLLTWDSLPDLPAGDAFTITVPVIVAGDTPSFTPLVNDFTLTYENPAGHLYQPLQASDTTTVIRRAAFVQGYVFDDTNGNGLFDTGENGIEGVELTLTGALTPTVTTNPTGFYRFRVEADGTYTLAESDPAGYISTTPNEVTLSIVRGTTYDVDFGDRPLDGASAAIFGTVFTDNNGNGAWDSTETGIEGVTVTLDGAEDATTDAYGRYTFGTVPPGPHTVVETDPPGYVSTTPNQVPVIAMADEDYQVDFGDIAVDPDFATIHGTVFADTNGNGARDGGEPGLSGVTVTLDGTATTTTNSYGRYWFLAVAAGPHTVTETDPSGYISTTPNEVAVAAVLGALHEVNFGDIAVDPEFAGIHGTVFADDDGDGVQDATELGLSGVTVSLDGVDTTTNSYGRYWFLAVAAGPHTVTETDPTGYISTTPNEVAVAAVLGESYEVNFGDIATDPESATIHGTVFADSNGNGAWDGGEAGIPGVTVTLDGTHATTTNSYGRYWFAAVDAGLHTVAETDPIGYISTTPNQVVVAALLGALHEVNFGDRLPDSNSAALFGTVFADTNGNGAWEATEPGIPAVTVTLDTLTATTTDEYGRYTFGTVDPGAHTVVETDLPGYISTTPNEITMTASAGADYQVDFGDIAVNPDLATIHGTVFSDDNGNGLWDGGEPGIPAVTVTLDGASATTTNSDGRYWFSAVSAGLHTVTETDPAGYTSTTPNEVVVDALPGALHEVNFGDVLLGTSACPPDSFEDDDDFASAKPLGFGTPASHDFCDADPADWHTITARRGYIYTFTTSAFGVRADTFLTLYDGDGTTVLAANDDFAGTTDFSSQIVWTAPASGTYYLRITNRTGLTEWLTGYEVWVDYEPRHALFLPLVTMMLPDSTSRPAGMEMLATLTAKLWPKANPLAPTGVIDHCNPDAFEVDDTWAQAGRIEAGVAQLHTFDSDPDMYAADKDFVAFDVGPGGSFAASVQSATTDTLVELYDANGQSLNRSGTDGLVWANAPMGRYYLGVSPATPAYACDGSVSYELTVDYTPLYRVLLPLASH